MKDDTCSMKLYKTTVDGGFKQTVCKARLMLGGLAGDEHERVTRLIQNQLGIGYDAAKAYVVSIFNRPSGAS